MVASFQSLKFRFPWRRYQGLFLRNLSTHMADNHLHVIAPPGSGKTLLGLEILRQIGNRTLVLAPTLTIRNQWEERLQQYFTENGDFGNVSFAMDKPSDITLSTYQGLHAFYKRMASESEFLGFFNKQGIKTIVLDEAHHLKNEWWKCLFALKQDQELKVVALTATPPFDSSQAEVKRYFDLCGEVDDEIAIPNLVKEGDLCPHQDFVHFSLPDQLTIDFIVAFRLKVAEMVQGLKTDTWLIDRLMNHRFYVNTGDSLPEIYQQPSFFSALLIFLHAIGVEIPRQKLKVLGFERKDSIEFPAFTNDWAAILLNYILFEERNHETAKDEGLKALEKRLRKIGVLKTHRVDLIGNESFYRTLSNSPGKLNSIVQIVAAAEVEMGAHLRAVVLTDYIRKEYLETADDSVSEISKLGVLPIFHRLRIALHDPSSMAVLTGSLVIVSKVVFKIICDTLGGSNFTHKPIAPDLDFVAIKAKNKVSETLVGIITDLFQKGRVRTLIGTKSLLGEGWDAPAINTLVLASSVGSFVTSNQMRGRAIRSYAPNPDKTAVIWHLICLDPSDEEGGKDLETLNRRFTAFMGISNSKPLRITNGMDRLDLVIPKVGDEVEKTNRMSTDLARNRNNIRENWQKAIGSGTGLVKELKSFYKGGNSYQVQKRLHYRDMVLFGFLELSIALGYFVPEFILKHLNILLHGGWMKFIYTLISALLFGFGVKAFKVFKLYINHGRLHKDVQKMGWAVLYTMNELGFLTSNMADLEIVVSLDGRGTVSCVPKGMSTYESTIFINALEQVIAPIENPRYLLLRGDWLRRFMGVQRYLVVPERFGENKQHAALFLKHWKRTVGNAKLLYTRHLQGRKALLKARMFHMSNAQGEKTKKSVIWH
ncbi:DEAD/DEAH box helicase family protein [Maribacter polysiphoniae]|uniref:DEAD/DEAH box helicase family protein n=1 Tax=Maribacter polysiphoniae TaxID=429344 RepID=A0A316E5M2_9FLAO|nr:DEAD/DEAH box helicase family protein [Maribacter polysiphoniae]MBD1259921.1 DEAD/DEAH box helicase family protein [Maribacter polysiphoniae]PWK25376.1 type III restriction/modification enzyme restriction subunit [Maribacter polysiphoniae]